MLSPHSLYLHIPFCVHRCAYCDFNTYAGLESLITAYAQALVREIEFSGRSAALANAGQPLPVHTIFFGGGTPSLLPLDALAAILAATRHSYALAPDAEISLEANPGTLTPDYLYGLRALGVNRLSLGMQSAHPDDLRLLERQHNLDDVIQACGQARRAGLDNFNLDLMFGLPGQSLARWSQNLELALSLRPTHLSLYALTVEHGTPLAHWAARGLVAEADPDLAAEMYELAQARLAQSGYTQYEISNWAANDAAGNLRACRHNLQYWRALPYLGLGAGAHGYSTGQRTVATLAPAAYIRRLTPPLPENTTPFPATPASSEIRSLSSQDELSEYLLMRLRLTQEGVPAAEFESRFGRSLVEIFPKQIERLLANNLLEWHTPPAAPSSSLRLSPRAYLLSNHVFRALLP